MKTKLLLLLLLISFNLNAQFTEDFEPYNLGPMSNQNISLWSTWDGTTTTYTIVVDDNQSLSGSQSGYVGPDYDTDAFLLLGNKVSGLWTLKINMYIPSNKEGVFNIQGEMTSSGGYIEFLSGNIFFNKENANSGIGIDQTTDLNFNFPHDTWFEILIFFDVDNYTYQLSVNGTLVNTTPQAFNTDVVTLGAIEFFSTSADTSYWVDDIQFVAGTLNVKDNIFNQKITLFPNPATNFIKVNNLKNKRVNKISIRNTLGQIIKIINYSELIDISEMKKGTYYVSVVLENGDKETYKIIKK